MSTSDLQALFANLKPKPRDSPALAHTSTHANLPDQPPTFRSVSPLPTSPPPPPPFMSSTYQELNTGLMTQPKSSAPSATAQSLLNLLNFGASASNRTTTDSGPHSYLGNDIAATEDQNTKSADTQISQIPVSSASKLLETFVSPSVERESELLPVSHTKALDDGAEKPFLLEGQNASQDALLKFLKDAHSGASLGTRQPLTERPQDQSRDQNGIKSLFTPVDKPNNTFSTPTQDSSGTKTSAQNKPIFTYTNPFEALHTITASPSQGRPSRNGTPAPNTGNGDDPSTSLENSDNVSADAVSRVATAEQIGKRKILTPRLASASKSITLSREASVEPTVKPAVEAEEAPLPPTPPVRPVSPQVKLEPSSGSRNLVAPDQSKSDNGSEADKGLGHEQPDGGDEWEDIEGPTNKEDIRHVPVYNFPIKPFVSIDLHLPEPSEVGVREDGVMEIARLKKEFDQLDRSLASATSKYIAYALIKNGGMRIIRQDDGSDRQLFKSTGDRVFNVAFCTTSPTGQPSDAQSILGTGISGAVYYATIEQDGNDHFAKNDLESESLIFPPYPPADENTTGGMLKTRAKRSSRHPEFFAIGRGKTIHLVWPKTALSPRYGIDGNNQRVDVEKFFQERALQIATGKAGKDFTFSEDDSLILSLDKTGRLRFWDIRKLLDYPQSNTAHIAEMTIDSPILTLSTASPSEKSWPTSVTFVDKVRPYMKGSALRYVLVGLRQNHTLQLWDIALGKAVQEVNFPHENETDGICSVSYHANSGIIVIGHPTRNSIFFIHLSAPRYTLPMTLCQAVYVQRIAQRDPDLPKPESTACMSGIREMSFSGKGQLRSVEILPVHRTPEEQKALDERTGLFELYVVHAKGVTCLNISKQDLGWNASSKIIHPINAAEEGYVSLKELRLGTVIEEGPRESDPVEEVPLPTKSSKKKSGKKNSGAGEQTEANQNAKSEPVSQGEVPPPEHEPEPADKPAPGPAAPKESKKNKKKNAQLVEAADASKAIIDADTLAKVAVTANATNRGTEGTLAGIFTPPAQVSSTTMAEAPKTAEALTVGIAGDWLDTELGKLEKAVSSEFRKELSILHQNIQDDRVVQDSAAIARQEALLRLVSTTLSNNVEKSMSRILATEIKQSMIPALTTTTVQAVTGQVGDAMALALHSIVPLELKTQLPAIISSTLQNPDMTRSISDAISSTVSQRVETSLNALLEKQIVPAFKALAVTTAETAASETEARLRQEIQHLETSRRNDMGRLEKLGEVLQATAATLQQMSDAQVAFQGQILKDRRQLALFEGNIAASGSRQVSTARATPSPRAASRPVPAPQKTPEQIEFGDISNLMNDGRYEEASIKWLQSAQPTELFDKLFIHFTPEYLSTDVSPLIAFSIAVTIGNSLTTNTAQRLEWISTAFHSVDLSDPEIADLAQHAPALLSSIIQKLEHLYMVIAERYPTDPALQIMPIVSRRAKEMRASLATRGVGF